MPSGKRVLRASGPDRLPSWLPGLIWLLWFPALLIYGELVVHLACFGPRPGRWLLFVPLFSLSLGSLLGLLSSLGGRRLNRVLSLTFTGLILGWLMAQTVYHTIFRAFLVLYSVGGAGQVLQFWKDILAGMAKAWLPLALLALPLVLLVCFGRSFTPAQRAGGILLGALGGAAGGFYLLALLAVNLSAGGILSPKYLYHDAFVPELSVSNFGVVTTLRLDAGQLLPDSGGPAPGPEVTPAPSPTPQTSQPPATAVPVVCGDNVMDLDLAALAEAEDNAVLQSMHRYFSGRTPTRQNEYTGLFQGKNLIWITAEGFSRFAVDPELTPTLWRLSHSGFVFEQFYNPLWWVSTLDGEYVALTSLIPKPGVWSLYQSGDNSMYFCMGNQLRREGYAARAYHNHTWDYYSRDVSHPNLGYDYKGLGHGLAVTPTWPESDVEMMELSVPEYVDNVPFHTYYMTVSGHMNYTFLGNAMAARHRDEVAHLELSENARAYLACQMELDRALECLLDQLEAAGRLEDTVICLSADHYPYGLEQAVLDELNGGPLDMRFDVYRSTLILWSGGLEEPVTVDKPCSSLDILPTLSNLFGLEYDSRLLMGRDILSDAPGLVVLSDRSFITDLGRYDAQSDAFIPAPGAEVPEGYAAEQMAVVNDMFQYSKLVLEQDYYGVLFGAGG